MGLGSGVLGPFVEKERRRKTGRTRGLSRGDEIQGGPLRDLATSHGHVPSESRLHLLAEARGRRQSALNQETASRDESRLWPVVWGGLGPSGLPAAPSAHPLRGGGRSRGIPARAGSHAGPGRARCGAGISGPGPRPPHETPPPPHGAAGGSGHCPGGGGSAAIRGPHHARPRVAGPQHAGSLSLQLARCPAIRPAKEVAPTRRQM